MFEIRLTEQEWLEFVRIKHEFPEWTVNLREACLDAFELSSLPSNSNEALALIAAQHLKYGPSRRQEIKQWKRLIGKDSFIMQKSETELREWLLKILAYQEKLEHEEDEINSIWDFIDQLLDAGTSESLVLEKKYAKWLRYRYWTDEEAVEFLVGTDDPTLFTKRKTEIAGVSQIRNKFDEIIPLKVCEWAIGQNWRPRFNLGEIRHMDPNRFDTLSPVLRKNFFKLLLATIHEKFDYPLGKGKRAQIVKACDDAGLQLSDATINKIIDDAISYLNQEGYEMYASENGIAFGKNWK